MGLFKANTTVVLSTGQVGTITVLGAKTTEVLITNPEDGTDRTTVLVDNSHIK